VIPPLGTLETPAATASIFPQFRHFNLSVVKNFQVMDRAQLQLRAEAATSGTLTKQETFFYRLSLPIGHAVTGQQRTVTD
jgi:hypothetical protein